MNTLPDFANASLNISAISGVIAALQYKFQFDAPRTDLDEQHIDLLVASAQGLIDAAEALKTVVYEGPAPE